jgi:hypothetical protein
VPPGIADAVTPNPVFGLVPSATVDEGNNWINVSWGPLSFSNDSLTGGANGNYGGGLPLGNYVQTAGSPVNNAIPCPGNARPCIPPGEIVGTPTTDFFGNPRPDGNGSFDIGAVELPGGGGGGNGGGNGGGGNGGNGALTFSSATNATIATVAGTPILTFRIPAPRAAVTSIVTVTNTGTGPLSITAASLTTNLGALYSVTGDACVATPLAAGATCTISIRYATPTVQPILPDLGALSVSDNGQTGGVNPLALSAR